MSSFLTVVLLHVFAIPLFAAGFVFEVVAEVFNHGRSKASEALDVWARNREGAQ